MSERPSASETRSVNPFRRLMYPIISHTAAFVAGGSILGYALENTSSTAEKVSNPAPKISTDVDKYGECQAELITEILERESCEIARNADLEPKKADLTLGEKHKETIQYKKICGTDVENSIQVAINMSKKFCIDTLHEGMVGAAEITAEGAKDSAAECRSKVRECTQDLKECSNELDNFKKK